MGEHCAQPLPAQLALDSASALAQNQIVAAFMSGAVAGLLVVGLAGAPTGRARTPPPTADLQPAEPSAAEPAAAEAEAGRCKPPAARARIKVNVKPDTEVAALIAWYSALTCTPLVVSNEVPVAGKKVTILSPRPITRYELDGLFLGALDSVGLTLERDGKFFYVIETAKARHSNTPVDLGR